MGLCLSKGYFSWTEDWVVFGDNWRTFWQMWWSSYQPTKGVVALKETQTPIEENYPLNLILSWSKERADDGSLTLWQGTWNREECAKFCFRTHHQLKAVWNVFAQTVDICIWFLCCVLFLMFFYPLCFMLYIRIVYNVCCLRGVINNNNNVIPLRGQGSPHTPRVMVVQPRSSVLTTELAGRELSPIFQHLPAPNRACLVGVYTFLIWNNLCDLVYQTPTKSYQSQIPVAFGIPGHVTTKHLLDTPC